VFVSNRKIDMFVTRQLPTALNLMAVAALACLSISAPVRAQSLLELFQEAKNYDATYLAAKSQAQSSGFKTKQAYALRRPMVNLKGNLARQRFDAGNFDTTGLSAQQIQQLNAQGAGQNATTTIKSLALEGKQAIYNGAANATIDQADQGVVVAEADLQAAENDLIVRLTQGYFDVLAAKDLLFTTQANKKALSEQLASAKRNFEVGNATITDTREAQARHDLASAQEIAALNELQVKKLALDQLVGRSNVAPRSLMTPVNLPPLEPANAESWVALTANSTLVRKATAGLKVAQLETKKARAEHMPTVDLVASVKNTKLDSSSVVTEASSNGMTSVVGVEVNVPLFAGFSTQNKIQESLALEEKSERDLDNAKRSVSLATRQAFFGVQSGMAQVKALEAAESSAKLALEATQLGYRVGVRINKDVLDAQTAVSNTQKDLYKARYDVLVTSMKLRQVSGALQLQDLEYLNRLLAPK
jgi:outer membrane protein